MLMTIKLLITPSIAILEKFLRKLESELHYIRLSTSRKVTVYAFNWSSCRSCL